jgi:hypothetical protein
MASSVSSTSTNSSTTAVTTTAKMTVVATLKKRSLVPACWQEAVRAVGMAECREAALTLAHAFAADDYARYLVVDADDGSDGGDGCSSTGKPERSSSSSSTARALTTEERKWRLHVDILTSTVASHCMSGLVTAIGPECDSVALWYVSQPLNPSSR